MSQPLALILGAGPGIGLAVARRFAREGFALALGVRPGEKVASFEQSLQEAGAPSVEIREGDLVDPATVDSFCAWIRDLDGLEACIYNASRGAPGGASQLDAKTFKQDFRVNLEAPLACTQAALPRLRNAIVRGRKASLLFTGGGLALSPKASEASLSIGKAALRSLALALAEELEPEGIHAATLTIAGFVQAHTPFHADALSEVFWGLHQEAPGNWRREVVLRPDEGER